MTPYRFLFAEYIGRYFQVVLLLTCTGLFGQDGTSFESLNARIDSLVGIRDTTGVTQTFEQGLFWAKQQNIASDDHEYLDFRLDEARYLLRYSKIPSDSAIVKYLLVYNDALEANDHLVQAKALGYLAGATRSKRELGRAFEY
ncbi:MAG: hypothetical protein AAF466_06445, partial [Bacteroidota bacterium]